MKQHFLLDPEIVFLNHGSFGATPKPVFERYQYWQREMERQPVDFIVRRVPTLLKHARERLAQYVSTNPENVVYVTNVTYAINAVARGLSLSGGDEVVASNQEYGAMDRTWRFLSQKQGFKYINVPITLPVTTSQQYIDDLWQGVSPNTRVLYLSHISSPTSIIAPLQEICTRARQAGIVTVIDGAHVPGQIELNLDAIGADFYGGNLHKWLCAPKGSGFLFASPRVQPLLEPLVVSMGWERTIPDSTKLVDYFEYLGTRDVAAFLSVPDAIDFQSEHGWPQIRERCHALAQQCLVRASRWSGLVPLYTPDSSWFAQMATIPLPASLDIDQFRSRLHDKFHIEAPFIQWNNQNFIRISFQAYNSQNDADIFLHAFQQLVPQGGGV